MPHHICRCNIPIRQGCAACGGAIVEPPTSPDGADKTSEGGRPSGDASRAARVATIAGMGSEEPALSPAGAGPAQGAEDRPERIVVTWWTNHDASPSVKIGRRSDSPYGLAGDTDYILASRFEEAVQHAEAILDWEAGSGKDRAAYRAAIDFLNAHVDARRGGKGEG
jgi:hypothetical protein